MTGMGSGQISMLSVGYGAIHASCIDDLNTALHVRIHEDRLSECAQPFSCRLLQALVPLGAKRPHVSTPETAWVCYQRMAISEDHWKAKC